MLADDRWGDCEVRERLLGRAADDAVASGGSLRMRGDECDGGGNEWSGGRVLGCACGGELAKYWREEVLLCGAGDSGVM